MFRSPFLFVLALCVLGLLSSSLVQCAPTAVPHVTTDDSLDEQSSPIIWSDEDDDVSEWTDLSTRDNQLEARGWLSSLTKITKTAKNVASTVKGTVTQVKDAVEASKDLLADFSSLATDAKSATTEVKEKAQEAITNIAQLPTDILTSLKDESKTQLENTLGELTTKVSSKLPTIAGLDEAVSVALVHLSSEALNKLENVADTKIAKLNATTAHAAESINGLFEAPANEINSFLTDVDEKYLQNLTSLADEYLTKAGDFCDTLGEYIDNVENSVDAVSSWTTINNAAEEISTLVISFTDAQTQVAAVEESSGLSDENRITANIFVELSEDRLNSLEFYLNFSGNLGKRDTETTTTKDVVKRILDQQDQGIEEC
ncbi:hypothetical protein N7495_004479 [Penicillium taxi]|uniref:uncharacterized protein n=1 Tax=Penicillium taxi TaxID=168475 RepID=UPI0025455C0A|nr:uncharacterized protein N7495_004479 [Penicillium taxi]KAJ5899735.1 hypothetical protein N7495_004479 [Penicillium taxi]